MSDSLLLLLTPLLLVPVVGLLGFVGCRLNFDRPKPPAWLTAVGQCDARVLVTWAAVPNATRYDLIRTDKGNAPIWSGNATSYHDRDVISFLNQPGPCYRVRVVVGGATSDYSEALCKNRPFARPFVSVPQGSLTLTATPVGFVGMMIELGANPSTKLEVCALGRFLAPNNGTNPDPAKTTHRLRIIDAVRDIDVASAVLRTVTGGPDFLDPVDSYAYVFLNTPVVLKADPLNPLGHFYVVSEERDSSGDGSVAELLGDGDTPVTSTLDGFVKASVFGDIGAWTVHRTGSFCFGPVNFRYRFPDTIL